MWPIGPREELYRVTSIAICMVEGIEIDSILGPVGHGTPLFR